MEVGLRSTRCFWPNGLSGAGAKMTLRTRANKTLEPLILDVFFFFFYELFSFSSNFRVCVYEEILSRPMGVSIFFLNCLESYRYQLDY